MRCNIKSLLFAGRKELFAGDFLLLIDFMQTAYHFTAKVEKVFKTKAGKNQSQNPIKENFHGQEQSNKR